MSEMKSPIKIHLLGKEYPITCSAEEEHDLLMAVRFLDEKMRHIRDTGRVYGTERIAVMAALNLSHELIQAQRQLREAHTQAQFSNQDNTHAPPFNTGYS